ncbi:MAG: hypothetical protein ACRELB_14085, partial [Polyangiaceae bacterium]
MRRALLAGLLLALPAAAGCAPTTTYRNTALVPAVRPVAWDGRGPQGPAFVVEGSSTYSTIGENLTPQVGDTALLVPSWTVEGSALIAFSKNVQVGLRGAYTSYQWAQPSAVGTMPIQGGPSGWGLGPELRLSFPLDERKHFALGIEGNAVSYQVPYAEWTLSAGCLPSSTCVDGYSLAHQSTESHMVYSLGVYPSYAFGDHGEYGAVFLVLAATSGFQNEGFTDQSSTDSTLKSNGPIFLVGGGYGIRVDWVHATALLFRPTTGEGSPVDYGLGVQLAFGV